MTALRAAASVYNLAHRREPSAAPLSTVSKFADVKVSDNGTAAAAGVALFYLRLEISALSPAIGARAHHRALQHRLSDVFFGGGRDVRAPSQSRARARLDPRSRWTVAARRPVEHDVIRGAALASPVCCHAAETRGEIRILRDCAPPAAELFRATAAIWCGSAELVLLVTVREMQ